MGFHLFSFLVNHAARRIQGHLAHGLKVAHITGTATDMDIERLLYGCLQVLFFDRIALELIDKNRCPCHKAGSAVTALKGKIIHKGLLYWRELDHLAVLIHLGVSFNGDNLALVKHVRTINTGARLLFATVLLHLDNGTGMADSGPATKAGAGQIEIMM